jgi:hypothetical protein
MPYADPNSEAAIASRRRRSRKTYYANREKQIARSRKWQVENMEHVKKMSVERRLKRAPEITLFYNAKNRAKAKGLSFDIEFSDIVFPDVCPILGIALKVSAGFASPNSPSIDRIDPSLGYVKGNIQIISHKANTIKSNATLDELKSVIRHMEALACRT